MVVERFFHILFVTVCLSLIQACTFDPAFDCTALKDHNKTRFDKLSHPIFIPSKLNLKKEVTFLFLQKDSIQQIHQEKASDPCLDSLMVQINDQLAFYKSWTTSLDPYLPEIYWDQLSTSAQKNAFLEMLPTVYTAGKESLQIAKITVESVQIRELESFFLFLNKNRDKDIDNEKLEQAKIAIKDFLAFIQSNKQ